MPRYGSYKYLMKPTEFLTPNHSLLQFHEIYNQKALTQTVLFIPDLFL